MPFERLMQLLFPARCLMCGEASEDGEAVCRRCAARAERNAGGYVALSAAGRRYCRWAVAPFRNVGLARQGVYRFKFKGDRRGAQVFGAEMVSLLRALGLDRELDCVAFVPMEETREKQRGYNQAELLARAVAGELELPVADGALRRVSPLVQHELSASFRRRGAGSAFAPGDAQGVRGKRVLLVDDLITTGETANACAALLMEMGAASVGAAAAAC